MHLTYTRAYWDRFCNGVLGVPIHHSPSRGGAQEGTKFERWYEDTLRAYRRIFQQQPPSDVWPDAAHRFGSDLRFKRVNLARHWVVDKDGLVRATRSTGILGIALLVAYVAVGSTGAGMDRAFSMASQIDALDTGLSLRDIVLIGGVAVALLVSLVRRRRCSKCGRYWPCNRADSRMRAVRACVRNGSADTADTRSGKAKRRVAAADVDAEGAAATSEKAHLTQPLGSGA